MKSLTNQTKEADGFSDEGGFWLMFNTPIRTKSVMPSEDFVVYMYRD